MKELKDYLHLYLGCECQFEDDIFTLGGVFNKIIAYSDEADDNGGGVYAIEEIKPILRPLTDMTEDEAIECGNMDYDFSEDTDLNKWSWKDFAMLNSSNQFLYLLSKHFDLFGLIETGLAIDSTILKTPQP